MKIGIFGGDTAGRTIDAITLLENRDKLSLTEAHNRVAQLKAAGRGGR